MNWPRSKARSNHAQLVGASVMYGNSLITLLGFVIMSFSGALLATRLNMSWEFAGLAFGILLTVGGGLMQVRKRIEDLERKVSDLSAARG